MATPIQGRCDSGFEPVRRAFEVNFERHGEVGARVSVLRDGETVVDLRGGYTTESREEEWGEDTLVCCMSVSKGVTALAAHLLASRGLLDYDAPVANYWPEFAQAGKEAITVRQAMSHQASLAVIDSAQPGDVLDWERFTTCIAEQAPNWAPCTDETYHSVTIGFITGEIVRRIDGRSIDQFIREELAEPLGADFILGCSDEDLARVVPFIVNPASEMMAGGGLVNERTLEVYRPLPGGPEFIGSPHFPKSVFPSGSGVSHSLALARLFSPLACGGEYKGIQYFDRSTLEAMSAEQWHHEDSMFGNDFRVAMGLLLNIPFNYWGREGNIGTAGAGGYCAFADSHNRISFAYTPNRFTSGAGLGDEQRRLVDALYACIQAQ